MVDQVAARTPEAGALPEDVTGTDLIFLQKGTLLELCHPRDGTGQYAPQKYTVALASGAKATAAAT